MWFGSTQFPPTHRTCPRLISVAIYIFYANAFHLSSSRVINSTYICLLTHSPERCEHNCLHNLKYFLCTGFGVKSDLWLQGTFFRCRNMPHAYDAITLVRNISGQDTSTLLSHRQTKLWELDLFMRCQPLVTDSYQARQLIAKTEQDHYTKTMTDCTSFKNEQNVAVQIFLTEDEEGCFEMKELHFTLIKCWHGQSKFSIIPPQLGYYWDKHSDKTSVF